MAVISRFVPRPPEAVFSVLADGWLYPVWVVGASRMRAVDDGWPSVGSHLHHSFGTWPFLIDDTTECLEWSPPRRMVLRARGWPAGEAQVVIEATATAGGCVVTLAEEPVRGPARLAPAFVTEPLLRQRNRETLRRLAYVAVR